MGPLSPTVQDTVRDKGLWERPLAGRVIAQPGEGRRGGGGGAGGRGGAGAGAGTGRQGSGRVLVLGTQGNPDRNPGALQRPGQRKVPKQVTDELRLGTRSTSERVPHTNFGLHGNRTGGKRMLFLTWGGGEETGRAGLATEGQRYKEVTFFPTPKLPLLQRRHGCLLLGHLMGFRSHPAKPKGNRQGEARDKEENTREI